MAFIKISLLVLLAFAAYSHGLKSTKGLFSNSGYGKLTFEKLFCQSGAHGKGKKTGNYAHPKHCDRFITCQNYEHGVTRNSRVTTQSCPFGLFFNQKKGVCDWARNVDCFTYQGKTCFGTRDNSYGSFKSSMTGYIRGMKLVHVGGYVTCKVYKPYKSFWGCNTKAGQFKYLVNTWITTATRRDPNYVIFPTKTTPRDSYGNYKLKGYQQNFPYIKWEADPYHPVKVRKGQQLKVWYGEDLHNIHEHDNTGTHCFDVYVLYSYYHPFYFLNH